MLAHCPWRNSHYTKHARITFQFVIWAAVALLLHPAAYAAAGDILWTRGMGGEESDEARGIATDSSDKIVVTGYFRDVAEFDPVPGAARLTSSGTDDIFVAKFGPGGQLLWVTAIGGSGADQGYAIATDGNGNIYVTGFFVGSVDFDPGVGTAFLTSSGLGDVFVLKLDAGGNFVWARKLGGTGNDGGRGIAVDSGGNVIVTGFFSGTADFNPGPSQTNLTAAGGADVFVVKLDADGDFVWARAMGGAGTDEAHDIALDSAGNIYTTGFFSGTADFDPGPGVHQLESQGGVDIYISKLNSSGGFVWAHGIGGFSSDQGHGIAVSNDAFVYIGGQFQFTVDFDPAPGKSSLHTAPGNDRAIFVLKLGTAGGFVWARSFGSPAQDGAFAVAADSAGNVYATGAIRGAVDFDPDGPINAVLTPGGVSSAFILKLDANGSLGWVRALGGDTIGHSESIAVDSSGKVAIAGFFTGTVVSGPPIPDLPNAGQRDILVAAFEAGGANDSSVPGDVNGDGVVDAVDVQQVINAVLGLSIGSNVDADINRDGVTDALDVQLVINAALGLDISDQL